MGVRGNEKMGWYRTRVRCKAGRSGGGSRQFVLHTAGRIVERRIGQGWREWAEIMPDRDAKLGTATGHRLGISKCFGGIPEVRYGGAL
jgi:hypothetical protein